MKNNYNHIAPVYDSLSRLVFGRAQVNVQRDLLASVVASSRILIVGGGTGWILEELAALCPAGLAITYVEISSEMLRIAKRRPIGSNLVEFLAEDIQDYSAAKCSYDVIITPFLFDNFLNSTAKKVFFQLDALLSAKGIWLYADFYLDPRKESSWKKGLLFLMYKFFGCVCRIEAQTLVDMAPYFQGAGYRELFCSFRYAGFIKGIVYQKP